MNDDDGAGDARFDPTLGAWVLTRHADVSEGLADPRLTVPGATPDAARVAFGRLLSAARLDGLEDSARELLDRLPSDTPVDLVATFARPWSLDLAVRVTGTTEAERMGRLAREVFLGAAAATGPTFPAAAQAAAAELAGAFPAQDPAAVQAFVALSQTLPALLAGQWLALLRHPAEADRLSREPDRIPEAVEELLRLAGPSRAVFRRAYEPVTLGAAEIAAGDLVALRVDAANHDPDRFPDPERLQPDRHAAGHLAFGRGAHACPGAPLVRSAAVAATRALLTGTTAIEPAGEVDWLGGFAIRAPATLTVVLRRGS